MASIPRAEFKQQIQKMEPIQFEHFVADIWSEQGWNTRVTRKQQDRGIDIVATKDAPVSEKHLIQVKRYGPDNPVGSPEVQQYASLRQQEQAVDAVIIVTSGRFSEQAERVARDLNVKLVDGSDLYNMINREGHFSIVDDYLGDSIEPSKDSDSTVRADNDRQSSSTESSQLSRPIVVAGIFFSLAIVVAAIFGVLLLTPGVLESNNDLQKVEKSVEHNGVFITVVGYTTRSQVEYQNLPEGAVGLLVKLEAENAADTVRSGAVDIEISYDGGRWKNGDDPVDDPYPYYGYEAREIYPDVEKSGWVFFEIQEQFEPNKTRLRMRSDGNEIANLTLR